MQSYTHFTLDERESLHTLRERGLKVREIATILGRSPSTISRELRRNSNKKTGIYNPWGGQSLYLKRRKACRPKQRFCIDERLKMFTQERLEFFLVAGDYRSHLESRKPAMSGFTHNNLCCSKKWFNTRLQQRTPFTSARSQKVYSRSNRHHSTGSYYCRA